jgi:hypothetical protein
MVVLTKSRTRNLVAKKYVSGKGKMTVVSGGAFPLALLAPVVASVAASAAPHIIDAIKSGKGLRPHGTGLQPHGGALPLAALAIPAAAAAAPIVIDAIANAIKKGRGAEGGTARAVNMSNQVPLMTLSQLLRQSGGQGLLPHGVRRGNGVEGGNLFKEISKGFKKVGKFLTSKHVKTVSRVLRTNAYPHIRKALPGIVPTLLKASTKIPYAGPVIAPIANNPLAQAAATKGAVKGLDALNQLAAKKGFGQGRGTVQDGVQYTKKQLNKTTKGLDKHSISLLNNMILSTPVKGAGLMPL